MTKIKKTLADFPELVKEWYPTLNKGITPDKVLAGSHNKYWWKCDKGPDHEWIAVVASRTNGSGCPYCNGKKVSATNSPAMLFPDIAAQWHPTRNGDVTPDKVVAGTNKKYWWKCNKGPDHEWEARLVNRTLGGTGCPCCSGQKLSVTNSLATLFPEIAAQWHPTRNGDVTPDKVVAGTNKKYWWKCNKGPDHEWKAVVASRTNGSGCPCCSGLVISVTNSLATVSPEVAAQWHPTRNGGVTPDKVVAGSAKKYWWKCDKGEDHEWKAVLNSRTFGGKGCPCCRGLKISVTNSLATVVPEVAAQWHPTRNGGVTPDKVVTGSNKKYWWICDKGPDHEWKADLHSRTFGGNGCPCCSGYKVSVTNSLAILFPEISAQWHPTRNGDVTPDKVVAGSDKKYWWKCDKGPDHEWDSTILNRTLGGTGCPCCSGQKLSVTNSLATLFPEIAAQWHPSRNGALTPDKVLAGSHNKYWWKCNKRPDHEWESVLYGRTSGGRSCPFCFIYPRSKTELYLTFELLHFFNFDVEEHKINSDGLLMDVDMIISEHKLIVEYDGNYWHKDKTEKDRNKSELLRELGWGVLRVREFPLEPLTPFDIQVPFNAKSKAIANRVLDHLSTKFNIPIPGLEDYKKRHSPINRKDAEAYIEQLLTKQATQSVQGELLLTS